MTKSHEGAEQTSIKEKLLSDRWRYETWRLGDELFA